MSSLDSTTNKSKSGWRSWLKNPAKANYNKVLAEAYEKKATKADGDATIVEMTDKEKAKAMVAHRDATSPTGSFMLGTYRPLDTSPGYAGYLTAQGAGGGS
jgi:hypothetical protein